MQSDFAAMMKSFLESPPICVLKRELDLILDTKISGWWSSFMAVAAPLFTKDMAREKSRIYIPCQSVGD